MDDSSELKRLMKKNEREILQLRIEKELIHLSTEVALHTIRSINESGYTAPDVTPWATKIVAIVKEHTL